MQVVECGAPDCAEAAMPGSCPVVLATEPTPDSRSKLRSDLEKGVVMRHYQCVRIVEADGSSSWHLTQEQSTPPVALRLGAWTSCTRWGEFRAGFERRRPTCVECTKHADADELTYG